MEEDIAQEPETVWVYLDETARKGLDGTTWRGAGAMVVPARMTSAPVAQALEALRADPDIQKPECRAIDAKTLARGHFHACEDSMNAHSHWLAALNSSFDGCFFYSIGVNNDGSNEDVFHQHLAMSLLSSLARRSRVVAVFEQRTGFGEGSATGLVEHMYRGLDWTAYDLPQVSLHYPRVEVQIRDKKEAGLQAVDFLLWAALQNIAEPDSRKAKWWSRVKARFTATSPDIGGGNGYGQLRSLRSSSSLAIGGRGTYQNPVVRTPLPEVSIFDVYSKIEGTLWELAKTRLPEHVQHLEPYLKDTLLALRRGPTREQVKDVARVFLRFFDTYPLYGDPETDSAFPAMYNAKRFAALMIRNATGGGRDLLEHLREARGKGLS